MSDPAGQNQVAPVTIVRILSNLSPQQVGELQAQFAKARKGLRLAHIETFDNPRTKLNFLEQPHHVFKGGVYKLTAAQPNTIVTALWQQTDRSRLSDNVPNQLGGAYLVEVDLAFAAFDSISGAGIVVDEQANGDRVVFLISRDNSFQVLTLRDGAIDRRFSSGAVP